LDENIFTISAATHYGINDWLKRTVALLRNTKPEEVYHIENVTAETPQEGKVHMIAEITDKEKKVLLDEGYIDPGTYEYAKCREIRDPEICKIVRMTWRGNPEAENHFRKVMDQQ
jgi:hypothetical protein